MVSAGRHHGAGAYSPGSNVATTLRRTSRGWIAWVVGLALLAGLVVYGVRHRPAPRIEVRAHTVTVGTVRDLVTTANAGRVAAHREASLRAEIAGRVIHLHHRRGERVAANEPLVTYDTQDLRGRLHAAEAAVSLARAQITQSEASARLAVRNAARAQALSRAGALAPAEAETLAGQSDVAERAVGSARAAQAQSVANAEVTRDALTRSVVRAPFGGLVLSTTVEEGEVTAPGAPLLALADTSELHIDADLDESDLGRVRVGMPAEVSLDAFPDERLSGRLSEIAPSVTQDLRGNRSVAIRVALTPDERLRVGMSADVDVVVATREGVVRVPPTVVTGRGTDRAVWVIEASVLHRRRIEVGVSTWESVEVLRGLRAGERVVANLSVQGLDEGVAVRVREGGP